MFWRLGQIVTLTCTARTDGATCRKRPRKVDLELTSLEAASWWTEDGYDTAEAEDSDALGESEESEEGEESEEHAEVSAPQRRRFAELGRGSRRGLISLALTLAASWRIWQPT